MKTALLAVLLLAPAASRAEPTPKGPKIDAGTRRFEDKSGRFVVIERDDEMDKEHPLKTQTRVIAKDKTLADDLKLTLPLLQPAVCGGYYMGINSPTTDQCPAVKTLAEFLSSLPEAAREPAGKELGKELAKHDAVILRDIHVEQHDRSKTLVDPTDLGGRF